MDDLEKSYHYGVIARALTEIDQTPGISLETLAARMSMAPSHFQRLFSAWVGVSPKGYQQYLTLEHARSLLTRRLTTLETAAASGLSGSGRLHDLFVKWEAMSPGDYARGGQGLRIFWETIDSPFGPALVMATERGICAIAFSADIGTEAAFADLAQRWPKADFQRSPERIHRAAERLFAPKSNQGPKLHLIGAPFQVKVWEALLHIPEGAVSTYSHIGAAIGHPKAQRAIGTAVGRNPIAWLIPCHRVLRRDGALGGYHWGLPVKRAMLAWEAARSDAR